MKKRYVIYNVDCNKILTSFWTWKELTPDNSSISYLFDDDEINKMKNTDASNWEIQPVYMREAYWSDTGLKIVGNLLAFWIDEDQEHNG